MCIHTGGYSIGETTDLRERQDLLDGDITCMGCGTHIPVLHAATYDADVVFEGVNSHHVTLNGTQKCPSCGVALTWGVQPCSDGRGRVFATGGGTGLSMGAAQ